MALAQRKFDDERSASDFTGPALPFVSGTAGAASPARALQDGLLVRTVPATRWPVGQRIALIVSASLALWTAILHLTVQVAHAVA